MLTAVARVQVRGWEIPPRVAVLCDDAMLLTGLGVGVASAVPRLAVECGTLPRWACPRFVYGLSRGESPRATLHRSSAERPGRPLAGRSRRQARGPCPVGRAHAGWRFPRGASLGGRPGRADQRRPLPCDPRRYHVREERTALVRQLRVLGQGHAADLGASAAASSGV